MSTCCFFFSSRRRHTRFKCDWSSDVCSSDLEIKIDHIERWNPDRIQRGVIVDHFSIQVSEITSRFQCLGRCKNISRHLDRRVHWQRDLQGMLAYHIEQETAAKLFCAAASKLLRKEAASIQAVSAGARFLSRLDNPVHQHAL